jgi:alpha-ketoglutarate-dependent taurine dioxygenase
MPLTIKPLTPALGAEVAGADLTHLTDTQFAEIFRAFTDHSVIFIRDQRALSPAEHAAFASRFGEIHVHPAARGRAAEQPGLMRMQTTETTRVAAGNRWHSDVSCDEFPPQASILQLHKIPSLGGDTLFSSLYAAYEALSERMKVMLDGLTARHSGEESFRHLFKFNSAQGVPWPENDHPIVRRHVDSGRPALFVDREFTRHINDLPKAEGAALLDFLFEHSERVDFQCPLHLDRERDCHLGQPLRAAPCVVGLLARRAPRSPHLGGGRKAGCLAAGH